MLFAGQIDVTRAWLAGWAIERSKFLGDLGAAIEHAADLSGAYNGWGLPERWLTDAVVSAWCRRQTRRDLPGSNNRRWRRQARRWPGGCTITRPDACRPGWAGCRFSVLS